jgi:hypothetical protein
MHFTIPIPYFTHHTLHAHLPRFQRLPECVRIVLTSRPQATRDRGAGSSTRLVRDLFKAWEPVPIEPDSKENQSDLDLVLRHRLNHGGKEGLVKKEELDAVVELMRQKSQGQFVW